MLNKTVIHVLLFLSQIVSATYANVVLTTNTLLGTLPIQSWKTLRDKNVVKQNYDYSCGAASLATILGFYDQTVTEQHIIDAIDKKNGMLSFEDIATIAPKFGFEAQGVALSFRQLTRLKIPAIAYVKWRKKDHFTVIRGISDHYVWLGDPSWGNRTVSKSEFLELWQTRNDKELVGKILILYPRKQQTLNPSAFQLPLPSQLPYTFLLQRHL
jgi:predicted double-glycine peptidase